MKPKKKKPEPFLIVDKIADAMHQVLISCDPNGTVKVIDGSSNPSAFDEIDCIAFSCNSVCIGEHPADTFDRMTALGYKLNLITGEYEKL